MELGRHRGAMFRAPTDRPVFRFEVRQTRSTQHWWTDGQRGWRTRRRNRENADQKRLLEAKKNHQVTFHGLRGTPANERCDELATGSADGGPLLVDEGFERSTDALFG
ncbi:MAG: hypothetical protein ACLTQI_00465 [Slackia sp.]